MTYFEVTGEKDIKKLGLKYEPREEICYKQLINDIPLALSLGEGGNYEELEAVADEIFLNRIVSGFRGSKDINKIHKISWDRRFYFPYMSFKLFEARYWLRVWFC